jgi:hypothetical protein
VQALAPLGLGFDLGGTCFAAADHGREAREIVQHVLDDAMPARILALGGSGKGASR